MNLRIVAVALVLAALAACTSTPASTPTPLPTAAPQPTATLAPTLPPTAPPTATATATPTAPSTATPTATATPISAWSTPGLIASGSYEYPAVVMDASGRAHVAAAGSGRGNRGIWYFTNGSGAWTKQRVSTPPVVAAYEDGPYDGQPAIAVATDGTVWIAFTRWDCFGCAPNPSTGVFLVNYRGGAWTEPIRVGGAETQEPAIATQGSKAFVVYDECVYASSGAGCRRYPVTLTDGSVTAGVVRDGSSPSLYVGPDGWVGVLTSDELGVSLATAQLAADLTVRARLGSEVENLPGSSRGFLPMLAVDPASGDLHAAWNAYVTDAGGDEHLDVLYAHAPAGGGAWSDPVTAVVDADLTGIAVAGTDAVHISASHLNPSDWSYQLLYASNLTGDFTSTRLADSGGFYSALAVGPNGRPAVVFAVEGPSEDRGLWYTEGTGPR